jgi:hypothetical protein
VKLSLGLWTEQRLRVFENRMLRRKFGPERKEVTTGCREVNNVECYAIYTRVSQMKTVKLR